MGKQRNISDDAELIRKHLLNEMSAEEQEKLDSRIKECPALCNIINELQQHGTVKEESFDLFSFVPMLQGKHD